MISNEESTRPLRLFRRAMVGLRPSGEARGLARSSRVLSVAAAMVLLVLAAPFVASLGGVDFRPVKASPGTDSVQASVVVTAQEDDNGGLSFFGSRDARSDLFLFMLGFVCFLAGFGIRDWLGKRAQRRASAKARVPPRQEA